MKLKTISEHTFIDSGLNRNSNIIDLGVNQGNFSKTMSVLYQCNIWGLEAMEHLFDKIPPIEKAIFFHGAAARNDGKVKFYKSPNNDGTLRYHYGDTEDIFEVKSLSFNTIILESGFKVIDLIKIDIEGAELDLILGINNFEVLRNIKQLTIEFHDFINKNDIPLIKEVCDFLKKQGFVVFKFSLKNYSNLLFVNKRYLKIDFPNLILFKIYKYVDGVKRILNRL